MKIGGRKRIELSIHALAPAAGGEEASCKLAIQVYINALAPAAGG
jgi:hypothetical protein